ncbi:MAG: HAMP domain-containing histidine kinase [Holdemanella sp.]|nr:HAMP domain-containing histidine kinase [Holdemanella sp.]
MKKLTGFFQKLSLTQQVLSMILLLLLAFAGFFFFFLGQNIESAISSQMYEIMANGQRPIISLLETELAYDENMYMYVSDSATQSNCLILDGEVHLLGDAKEMSREFYVYLAEQSMNLTKTSPVYNGFFRLGDISYYYRLTLVTSRKTPIVVASYMDNSYAKTLQRTLVDSTVYVTILAFFIFFMIMMIWVFSIIHPLNQIKNYIEKINKGEEVELHINRQDEIGEVAHAIVTMKDELTKQEKAKEEMIHNISHDLKTPIATIKSYSESIKDGIYPYGTLESSVDVILNNAQRLEDKVHNLLYLNRIEYLLTSDSEGVVTNMKDVVEQVVLNSAVIRPEIEVFTDVEEVFFDGLLEAWRVSIENIMDNAFRYAKSYIKIYVRENDLRISNDGPKMPEDRIDSLFRPFEKGEGGRFGLGLSIVHKVSKANNYIVMGYNTEDGVCFRIYRKEQPKKHKEGSRFKKDSKKEA